MEREQLVSSDGKACWGLSSPDSRLIELEANQAPSRLEQTFIHEALHACWPRGIVGDETEEALVGLMTEPLLDVVRAMVGRKRG